jgi:hypothetical protein
MTKHVSLETQLIDNDYLRPDDNAIMVEVSCGRFVHSHHESTKRHAANDNAPEIESEEIIEVPWHAKSRKGLTDFETLLYGVVGLPEKAPEEQDDDKRRIRTKPKCNPTASKFPWRDFTILRKLDDKLFLSMASHAVGFQHKTPRALANILAALFDNTVPLGLCDNAAETRRNRARIEQYNADFPESENPEHTLQARESRNASPTREKDTGELNALLKYRELNESAQPLQSNFLQADNDNFADPEWEEGDLKQPQRDAEAELETRPNDTELVACYDMPTVMYETRMVSTVNYPRLIEPGYCLTCGKTEMIVPVGGDVRCIGFNKDKLLEHDASARNALPKRGIKRTQNRINDYADRIEKPTLLNINDVAKYRKWTFFRMGGAFFAPYRTKRHYRGQLTHYTDSNGQKRVVKEDEFGTPYGPESMGSDDRNWMPLNPRTTKREVARLSPSARAKQLANKVKPISCPMTADEALESFRLRLITNGRPANDNLQHDGLPYDVESKDQLQFGYAFGKSCADTTSEKSDDATDRKQTLIELNARLSPQARLVANMVVQTDETDTLAKNYADVGAALVTGRKKPSERTLMRHGETAVTDAANEIGTILQELAA